MCQSYSLVEVLLLTFTENVDLELRTQFFECFSGKGAVSGVFRKAGVPTVNFDEQMDPGKRTMNFLSEAGFAPHPQYSDFRCI